MLSAKRLMGAKVSVGRGGAVGRDEEFVNVGMRETEWVDETGSNSG